MTTKRTETNAAGGAAKGPQYSAGEFAAAADRVFGKGTSPDIVRAAFRASGISSATVEEAKKLVKAFAEREVER